jgi:hypothetical protein
MSDNILIKVIFDAATFWLGNKFTYSLDSSLENKPNLSNLTTWTLSNLIFRYKIIEHLQSVGFIATNEEIYLSLGVMSFAINNIVYNENNFINFKKCAIGTMSNILASKVIYPKPLF